MSRRADADPEIDAIPHERLAALVDEIATFPALSMGRGRSYASAGRVELLEARRDRIVGRVQGTRDYETVWAHSRDGWSPDCTCPVGYHCKHAYAVACIVLGEARRRGFHERRLRRLLPREEGSAAAPALPGAPPAGPGAAPGAARLVPLPGAEAAGRAGVTPPRAPDAPRRRHGAVERLAQARDFWERHAALQRLLHTRPDLYLSAYEPPFPEILHEPDSEVMLWRLAHELEERTGVLPAGLESYLERPDIERRHREGLRERIAGGLAAWARQRRASGERALRVVLDLVRHDTGEIGCTLEARATSPRLDDQPRTHAQLYQLRNAVRRNPALLSTRESELLDLLTDNESPLLSTLGGADGALTSGLLRLLEWFGNTTWLVWSEELPADLAALAGVEPGTPVRFRRSGVRVMPEAALEPGGLQIRLGYFRADGERLDPGRAIHLIGSETAYRSQRSLVLAAGEFAVVTEEPPRSLVRLFREAGAIPVERERAEELVAPLLGFESMRRSLEPLTRRHRASPLVTLELFRDDWLRIRLFARPPGSGWRPQQRPWAGVFEYLPEERWAAPAAPGGADAADPLAAMGTPAAADAGSAPAGRDAAGADPAAGETGAGPAGVADGEGSGAAGDAWLEAPEPEDVRPVLDWLAATRARPGGKRGPGGTQPLAEDRGEGWWLRIGARTVEGFERAWQERPPAEWLGNERARRMLMGVARVSPRLRVRSTGIDWFTISAEWESEGLALTDADLARLRAARGKLVKLPQGWVRRDAVEVHDEVAELLADLGIEPGQGEQAMSVWHLARAEPRSLEALVQLGADADAVRAARELRERIASFTGPPRVPVPSGFHGELRPYQRDGLDFLAATTSLGLGAILADDMGLGKTIQTLAWLQSRRESGPPPGPALVVCPASVMHNWVREAARFVPDLQVLLLERGGGRHVLRRDIPGHHLVVTNYALLRRDLEAWKRVELSAAILDEAQNVKNPDAAISRAVLELRAPARVALTGTPLENRALDLWSIMAFLNPGYLGSRASFVERYDRPDAPPHARRLLAARLRPVMLRRLKRQVAQDLPERIEERRDCALTRGQRQLYAAELTRSRDLIRRLWQDPRGSGIGQARIEVLAALTRLRQICCHPALAGGAESLGSGKFDALFELLEPLLAEGHKVVLFSQFVRCLDLIAAALEARAIPYHVLTGQSVRRERIVAGFTEDPRAAVFLVSLKAGGTGLNLTAASYVVLFDPWWNPAVEAQAIDRTHRIGQDRTVIAYRMIAEGTVEERIHELQQRKAALVRDVLGEDGFARALTRDDLDYLLGGDEP